MSDVLLFGDLHNHNALGIESLGKGSFERSLEAAHNNLLDFWAFTPHAHWPDPPEYRDERMHGRLRRGFARVQAEWDSIVDRLNMAYRPGSFTTIIGFERHSTMEGDHHVLYPGDSGDLVHAETLADMQNQARRSGALMVPHHVFYSKGRCGANWKLFSGEVSPVVEIFSEHGSGETDAGPYPGVRHSVGGRATNRTVRAALTQGLRFGFAAGTDDHWASPGSYGEGLTAVRARANTREGIFAALRERRTYAITGDRMEMSFGINEGAMGSELRVPMDGQLRVKYLVQAWDTIDRVELVRNGKVVYRAHPIDASKDDLVEDIRLRQRVRLFVQFGWGAYTEWMDPEVYDWRFEVTVTNGDLRAWTPAFSPGPFIQDFCDHAASSGNSIEVSSRTGRLGVQNDNATKGVWLEIDGTPDTELHVDIESPAQHTATVLLGDLAICNYTEQIGRYVPSPSFVIHRPTTQTTNRAASSIGLDRATDRDWHYLRVTLLNGHMGWSSPVWVDTD